MLVIDETGDLKKGRGTVGVQRQYSGTAGKIENCQLAVHLVYATEAGHAMLDAALYLPKSWCDDAERRAEAGVPEQVRFATKPQLASRMIEAAVTAGLPCRWAAGDEAYGNDPRLAAQLRQLQLGYVLAVACSHQVSTGLGVYRVDALAAGLPATAWQRVSAGRGAKGHRYYDWSFTALPHAADGHGGHHWLLIRRNRKNAELAFYRCWSPEPVPLRTLVLVAGRRPEDRGIIPSREDRPRPRPAPTPPLDILAPVDHPDDPRPRLPRRRDRQSPSPPPAGRTDPADRQRTTPIPHPDHRTHPPTPRPTPLVHPPTPSPSPSHDQPLHPTIPHRTMITIPGWSIRRAVLYPLS